MTALSGEFSYPLAFALATVVSFATAGWVHARYDARGTRPFTYTFVAIGFAAAVSCTHLLFADSQVVTEVAAALELGLLGAAAVPWFYFAAQYTDHGSLERRDVRVALGGFLAVAIVLPLSNPLHGLVYPSLIRVTTPFVHY